MKRYILTGAPGCGKTSLIRALEMTAASVVDEAATDVIIIRKRLGNLVPWEKPNFIDDIIRLQKQRQIDLCDDDADLHFYDRSPICTYALAIYLGFEPSADLMNEIERIHQHNIYEKRVFFIENLGFITNTDARKISFEDSLKFEQIHLDVYKKFHYECVMVPVMSIVDRVKFIMEMIK